MLYQTIFYCIARLPMSRQPFIQVSPPSFQQKNPGNICYDERGFYIFFFRYLPWGRWSNLSIICKTGYDQCFYTDVDLEIFHSSNLLLKVCMSKYTPHPTKRNLRQLILLVVYRSTSKRGGRGISTTSPRRFCPVKRQGPSICQWSMATWCWWEMVWGWLCFWYLNPLF